MKILFLLLVLATSALASDRAATGFEVGVARLSDGDRALMGTSILYHFDYHPDNWLGFFGQIGRSEGKDNNLEFSQIAFTGGLQLYLLPAVDVRLGLAKTVNEIEKDGSTKKEEELGPMVGVVVSTPMQAFRLGASGSLIKTKSLSSSALRVLALIEF